MASLWESMFLPAKLLPRYGNIMCNYLKSINGRKLGLPLVQVESETKSLQNLKEVERIIGSFTGVAADVDTEKLAQVAVQHNFHRYIRFGTKIYMTRIQTFINALPKYPLHSHGLTHIPKVLADVVESNN